MRRSASTARTRSRSSFYPSGHAGEAIGKTRFGLFQLLLNGILLHIHIALNPVHIPQKAALVVFQYPEDRVSLELGLFAQGGDLLIGLLPQPRKLTDKIGFLRSLA